MVFLCRSELSVEKTSVLQSELQSVKQLQELEPLNKCKCFFLYVIGSTGNNQLHTETDLWLSFFTLCACVWILQNSAKPQFRQATKLSSAHNQLITEDLHRCPYQLSPADKYHIKCAILGVLACLPLLLVPQAALRPAFTPLFHAVPYLCRLYILVLAGAIPCLRLFMYACRMADQSRTIMLNVNLIPAELRIGFWCCF